MAEKQDRKSKGSKIPKIFQKREALEISSSHVQLYSYPKYSRNESMSRIEHVNLKALYTMIDKKNPNINI